MTQIFKIMMIGDVSTGKTSFLTQLIYQIPEKMPKPTTQWSFFTLRISSPPTVIQIWDTPGDQRFYFQAISILQTFKAILIFIDVTSQHTFNRGKLIIDQLKMYPNLAIHLILSKVDVVEKMKYKKKVNLQDIQKLSKQVGGLYFQYSQTQKIQEILQKIVHHGNQGKSDEKRKNGKGERKIFNNKKEKRTGIDQQQNQFCECQIL